MARTKAISLIQTGSTKVELSELSGLVISNIQKETLAAGLKSQSYTGNPATGSVEYKRFKNSASQAYGTARTAGKGAAITVPPTTVNLDIHREIVEEAAKFDLDTFGVGNIMARRADNHVDTVAAELDADFFAKAKTAGTKLTAKGTTVEDQLEELIQAVETVKNDYVRGVPRNLIRLVLDPVMYGRARNYLDMLIFLSAYLANVTFSLWYNIKLLHEPFDREKLINSAYKIATFVIGLTLLCVALTTLPLFANEVGWAIPQEYTDLFADLVIIGAVLLVSCKYIKEAFVKFTEILNAGTSDAQGKEKEVINYE